MEGYNQNEIYSEKEKDSEEYLVGCTDAAISELVREKGYLRKAYNYYNGMRDAQQFRMLEENYGIGTPTAVEFIPLIRRHIDALVGQHLQNKLKPKVTCKDRPTLMEIERKKQLAIYEAEVNRLKTQFYTNFDFAYAPKDPNDPNSQQIPMDIAVEEELAQLKDDISKNFVSEFEIAAQNILLHLAQSKSVDLYNKLKLLFLDILVAGQCFYKVKTIRKGETPRIEILNPFDVFVDKSHEHSSYVKDCHRIVVRRWYYKDEVLARYGHFLKPEDLDCLTDISHDDYYNNLLYVRAEGGTGLIANVGVALDPMGVFNEENNRIRQLIPVYEVEWLTTNKMKDENGDVQYRTDRYKSTRIGGNIYVDMGKDDTVIRSMECPLDASTSTNGIFYSDRNGKPYSLVIATANIQDRYDLLHFYMEVLFATSGTNGDWIDVANLPTFLGDTPEERLMKFKAYKKQGLALINTAQDERGANHNTVFNGFKDTVDGNSIQAYLLAIQQTEETCSAITGVFRELLGGIEQKDAVSNVEVGVKTSAVITKPYFQVMDSLTTQLLIDGINQCKESYRNNGMMGSLILGDKMQKIFSISPENFSFTDYDVHIADSGDMIRDMQKIDALTMEMVKGGVIDIEVVFEGIGTESMTEMKENIITAVKKKKAEMNQIQQLTQQVEQAQSQIQQISQQAKALQVENDALKAKGTALEEKAIDYDYAVRKQANDNNKEFNDKKIDLDQKRIELEKLQLFDNDPNNNEIRND